MKRKRLLYLGLALTILSGAAACGTKQDTVKEADKKIEAGTIFSNDKKDESVKEASNEENNEEINFISFLNNEEPVYFDKVISNSVEMDFMSFSGMAKADIAGKPFTFSEMVRLICESETKAYWTVMEPESISYSFVDCGMDGKKELVIALNNMGENLDYTDIFVVSLIEDKLQVVFCDSYGYRTYGSINENGYYCSGGSAGAANSIMECYFIDKDGNVKLDYYSEQIMDVWGLFIPDNTEYEIVADEQGVSGKIEIERYSFDYTNEGEDYIDYLLRSKWTYYALDENYNQLTDDSIYEDGNPYRIFWESTRMPLSTKSELDAQIMKHRDEIGLSQEVVNGADANFTTLDEAAFKKLFEWKTNDYKYEGIE